MKLERVKLERGKQQKLKRRNSDGLGFDKIRVLAEGKLEFSCPFSAILAAKPPPPPNLFSCPLELIPAMALSYQEALIKNTSQSLPLGNSTPTHGKGDNGILTCVTAYGMERHAQCRPFPKISAGMFKGIGG